MSGTRSINTRLCWSNHHHHNHRRRQQTLDPTPKRTKNSERLIGRAIQRCQCTDLCLNCSRNLGSSQPRTKYAVESRLML